MKVYQINLKTFYKMETANGEVDVQCADCGTIPETYSSKKKAEKRFEEILEKRGIDKKEIGIFPYTHATYNWLGYRTVITLQEVEVY